MRAHYLPVTEASTKQNGYRHMLTRAHTIMCVYIHLEGPPLLSLSSVTCVSVDEPANDLHWQIATSVDRMVDYTHTHANTMQTQQLLLYKCI